MVETSILPAEAERFGRIAADWWDPDGASAMLHKLNPVRLQYVRDQIDRHWQVDERGRTPLAGKTALDVGCGAGLLAEPLARLGATVTGIDASPEVIAVAREHAAHMGLAIDYHAVPVEQIEGQFDLVAALEVIEHVAEPAAFLRSLAQRLAPGGLMMLSTPNATRWSKLLTITMAEGLGRIPRGTHDYAMFIAPGRMQQLLADAGLSCVDVEGIAFSPTRGLHLSDNLKLNYLVAAVRA
jgi:2-polyprenyl-6-hydroxyphenyl methylase/3-demethylubiquinone-9 3-methyltransferase